jgi:hypothetical protein
MARVLTGEEIAKVEQIVDGYLEKANGLLGRESFSRGNVGRLRVETSLTSQSCGKDAPGVQFFLYRDRDIEFDDAHSYSIIRIRDVSTSYPSPCGSIREKHNLSRNLGLHLLSCAIWRHLATHLLEIGVIDEIRILDEQDFVEAFLIANVFSGVLCLRN